MDIQNLESVLSQMTENKLSEEDHLKIKEILGKYNINKTTTSESVLEHEHLEEGFEFPESEWEDPSDLDFTNHDANEINVQESEVVNPVENFQVKSVLKIDENGQYQLPLDESQQMELDLSLQTIEPEPVIQKEIKQETTPENIEPILPEINNDGRKEPVLSLEGIEGVEANAATLDTPILPPKSQKFKNFENMAQNAMGKVHNLFNFRDENGKIDWYGAGKKTVLVLKNVKNAALDNIVVNRLKGMIVKKYSNSKFGIKTNQIADTITVNLMSREERYNREFKNTISLLGYDVKELITPKNEPMLTLQEVSDNLNKNLKENLGLELTNNGYSSDFIKGLNEDQKAQFIQTIVWPKLTEMMAESMKLFEALKDIKAKNPLCREIAQVAKKNDMEPDLFATLLSKSPEILKQKGIKGIDSLLERKEEIENVYFKNEELFGKNFVVLQNLVKASASIQKIVIDSNLSKDYKQKILTDMKTTVIKSDTKKKVLFDTVQESITSSLQDADFVKSLREVNDSILKIRKIQNKETTTKPKM